MSKKKILEDYKKKLKDFEKYNEAYYDKNKPLISIITSVLNGEKYLEETNQYFYLELLF